METILHALVQGTHLTLVYDLPDSNQITIFDSFEKLRIGEPFLLYIFDEFCVLIAKNEGVELVVEVFLKVLKEVVVEVYKFGN